MKVAILTTDNREHFKQYDRPMPFFGTAPEALLQGFAQTPNTEIHVVSCAQQPMPASQQLAPNIFFHHLHVPKIGWMRTAFGGCILAIRKKLREIKPDIVHGQGTERECAISAVFSGYPNVITIHGNMAELARLFQMRVGSFGWLAAHLENFSLCRTAGVFCNSAYTQNLVAPRSKKTWLVANAIRQEFLSPVTHPNAPVPRPTILNVGLVSPRKRQVELLDVIKRLASAGHTFEFQFIGLASAVSSYGASFFEKLKPLELSGHARYLGMQDTLNLIRTFDGSHAMVHFPNEEAFGLVVAEALARNLKFFGAQLGGIVDIARDVPEATLVDGANFNELYQQLAIWLKNGATRPEGQQELMRSRYHPHLIAQKHLAIYREVLQQSKLN